MKKRGITLLALMLVIIISLIIVTTSIVSLSNIVNNSKITDFIEKMKSVEEQVAVYYIENKSFPVANNDTKTLNEIKEIVNTKYGASGVANLEQELQVNGDSSPVEFRKLDVSKINITRIDNKDDYYICVPTLHVYCLAGMKIGGKVYFSISSEINASNVIRDNYIGDVIVNTTVQENLGLKVSRRTSSFTNKLGITIESQINSNERIYVSFNDKDVLVNTTNGQKNTIYFDSLVESDLNGLDANAGSSYTFTAEDMSALGTVESKDRFIKVSKTDSEGNIIAQVNIYINNFDIIAPSVDFLNNSVISKDNENILTIYPKDEQSGIKEVRYEYFTTGDRTDGNTGKTAYYSGSKITRQNLVNAGKKAIPSTSDGKVEITVPKGVSSIKLVIIDKALNVSDAIELATENEKEIYYSLHEIKPNRIRIQFYGMGFSSGNYSYSSNLMSAFSNQIPFSSDVVEVISDVAGVDDKIYIKVSAAGNTRIIELELPKTGYEGTTTKTSSKWYNPYIPNGFAHIEGNVETGFVIQDCSDNLERKYNEFVWIPVDNNRVKYEKIEFGIGAIAGFNAVLNNSNLFTETNSKASDIIQSIERYGGFYIARYEASNGPNSAIKSVKGEYPISSINYSNALAKANAMYNSSSDIESTIMTAAAFDTTMKFLSLSLYNVDTESTNNNKIGNYSNSIAKTGDSFTISNVDYTSKLNNIYDIAGNVAEFTSETYSANYPVFRGGAYDSTGVNRICAVRSYNSSVTTASGTHAAIGFRVMLFIK